MHVFIMSFSTRCHSLPTLRLRRAACPKAGGVEQSEFIYGLRPYRRFQCRRLDVHRVEQFSTTSRTRKGILIRDTLPPLLLSSPASEQRSTAVSSTLDSIGQVAHLGAIAKRKSKYACITCAKAFASTDALERHAAKTGHQSATKLPAAWLNRIRSQNAASADSSGNTSSPAASIRLYNHHCEYCGLGFKRPRDMKEHVQAEHRGYKIQFRTRADLAHYMKTHCRTLSPGEQNAVMDSLPQLCHSRRELVDFGYVFDSKTQEDLQRCDICRKTRAEVAKDGQTGCRYHPSKIPDPLTGIYRCCGRKSGSAGCKPADSHNFPAPPEPQGSPQNEMTWTPTSDNSKSPKPAAVTLGCSYSKSSKTPTNISVVNFLTGRIILDRRVDFHKPRRTADDKSNVLEGDQGESAAEPPLRSMAEIHEELFKNIGSNTILIGHALHANLSKLGIAHDRVVDSAIVAQKAVEHLKFGETVDVKLKQLAKTILGVGKGKNQPHPSLQAAATVREVIVQIAQFPKTLDRWIFYVPKYLAHRASLKASAEGGEKSQHQQKHEQPQRQSRFAPKSNDRNQKSPRWPPYSSETGSSPNRPLRNRREQPKYMTRGRAGRRPGQADHR